MKRLSKNKGILFWVTGLSGSGKTSLAKKIFSYIEKKHGPTIILSGDDIRKIFELNNFSYNARYRYASSYSRLCKKITDGKINVILATVSLFHRVRSWNRKNIKNYVEIYIKSDIEKVIKKKKKFFYKRKFKNIVGKNLRAEFPKSPDIVIKNNFDKSIEKLSKELIKKIKLLNGQKFYEKI